MKLRVEKAVYGGAGLAHIPRDESPDSDPRLAGKTVFIPYALPGELVEAHIVDDRRGFSTAELDRVIEPASERVSPHCEYFPVCGGCQYQQASRELEPYRSRMQAMQIRQIERQFLHKRLLEKLSLPRLSLFYMSQS